MQLEALLTTKAHDQLEQLSKILYGSQNLENVHAAPNIPFPQFKTPSLP